MKKNISVDLIDLYSSILLGETKRFPDGTWERSESGKQGFIRCFRWLVLVKLNMSNDQIIKLTKCNAFFAKYKLATPYIIYADSSYYTVLKICFPEWNILPWDLYRVPLGFYDKEENRNWAIRWLTFEKLKLVNREDVLEEITSVTIYEHGFKRVLDKSESLYDCLSKAFPEFHIKEYEVRVMNRDVKLVVQELRNFIENVLGWDLKQIENELTKDVLEKAGFGNVLITHFDSSPTKLLRAVYPEFSWDDKPFKLTPKREAIYNSMRKLSNNDLRLMLSLRDKSTLKELATKFNVSETTVLKVFKGDYKHRV